MNTASRTLTVLLTVAIMVLLFARAQKAAARSEYLKFPLFKISTSGDVIWQNIPSAEIYGYYVDIDSWGNPYSHNDIDGVVKLDSNGKERWNVLDYEPQNFEFCVASDGIYISWYSWDDKRNLVKYSRYGEEIWQVDVGEGIQWIWPDMKCDEDDAVLLSFTEKLGYAKFSAAGEHLYDAAELENNGGITTKQLLIDNNGNIWVVASDYVAGQRSALIAMFNKAGETLWVNRIDEGDIEPTEGFVTPDNKFMLFAVIVAPENNRYGLYRVDADGVIEMICEFELVDERCNGGSSNSARAITSDGNAVMCRGGEGSGMLCCSALNAEGEIEWELSSRVPQPTAAPGTYDELYAYPIKIAADDEGAVYLSAYSNWGIVSCGNCSDTLISFWKIDRNGDFEWRNETFRYDFEEIEPTEPHEGPAIYAFGGGDIVYDDGDHLSDDDDDDDNDNNDNDDNDDDDDESPDGGNGADDDDDDNDEGCGCSLF